MEQRAHAGWYRLYEGNFHQFLFCFLRLFRKGRHKASDETALNQGCPLKDNGLVKR